jgi:hypothetical protein
MLVLLNNAELGLEFSGLSASFEAVATASAKFDLSLRLAERTVEALVQRLGDVQAARATLRGLARPAEIPLSYAGSSCSRRAPDETTRWLFIPAERRTNTLGVPRQQILDADAGRPRLALTAVSEASLAGDACIAEQRGAWAEVFGTEREL